MRPPNNISRGAGSCARRSALWAVLIASLSALGSVASVWAAPEIVRIRYFTGPDHTRVVLDLSQPVTYTVRQVANPERIVVNIGGASFRTTATVGVGDGLVQQIRRNSGNARAQVVVDLELAAQFKVFDLPAADGRPDRIVLDVYRPQDRQTRAGSAPKPEPVIRPYTVVIDPGHGGLDPGAIRNGIREKDVVLDVCRRMAKMIDDLPGYRTVLTRKRDYYPSLTRRVEIAREAEGDLFLSIHCNTHRKRSIKGMEVYFLSLQGATDREARELADKENAADLVGLAPENAGNDLVVSILMDLRMTQVLYQSSRLAEYVLASARASDQVDARRVKQARFQVLRNLAMPSALIELAYLSNPDDRRLLSKQKGRKLLAELVVAAVLRYRQDEVALALLMPKGGWTQNYRVRRGDSLWKLARRYGTTVTEISQRNNLNSAGLKIGQTLMLPEVD